MIECTTPSTKITLITIFGQSIPSMLFTEKIYNFQAETTKTVTEI